MGSIFNPDSKFTHFTNKFSDLITLNLWFVLTSLPLITIGASATAMHYVFSESIVTNWSTASPETIFVHFGKTSVRRLPFGLFMLYLVPFCLQTFSL